MSQCERRWLHRDGSGALGVEKLVKTFLESFSPLWLMRAKKQGLCAFRFFFKHVMRRVYSTFYQQEPTGPVILIQGKVPQAFRKA